MALGNCRFVSHFGEKPTNTEIDDKRAGLFDIAMALIKAAQFEALLRFHSELLDEIVAEEKLSRKGSGRGK